jgi:hypothetical protein
MNEHHPADPHAIQTGGAHGIQTGSAGHAIAPPFPPEEWQQFRNSDVGACKAVVLLMGSIFTIGLILYSTIDYLIWW